MQFNVANKIDVGTSRCIDKDTTFISSISLLNLKVICFSGVFYVKEHVKLFIAI